LTFENSCKHTPNSNAEVCRQFRCSAGFLDSDDRMGGERDDAVATRVTPLHLAAWNGRAEATRAHILKKYSLSSPSYRKYTRALMIEISTRFWCAMAALVCCCRAICRREIAVGREEKEEGVVQPGQERTMAGMMRNRLEIRRSTMRCTGASGRLQRCCLTTVLWMTEKRWCKRQIAGDGRRLILPSEPLMSLRLRSSWLPCGHEHTAGMWEVYSGGLAWRGPASMPACARTAPWAPSMPRAQDPSPIAPARHSLICLGPCCCGRAAILPSPLDKHAT